MTLKILKKKNKIKIVFLFMDSWYGICALKVNLNFKDLYFRTGNMYLFSLFFQNYHKELIHVLD